MKKSCYPSTIAFLIATAISCFAQSSEFSEPWKDKSKAIVIDPYEGNSIGWDKLAADSRVVAIIHRATIGSRKDKRYSERREQAKGRGYK